MGVEVLTAGLETAKAFVTENQSVIAASGLVLGGAVAGTGATLISQKLFSRKKTSKRRKKKSKSSRRTRRRGKHKHKRSPGGHTHYHTHRRNKAIHYTKNGQPYVIMASGKARFISKRGAKQSKKRKGGRY